MQRTERPDGLINSSIEYLISFDQFLLASVVF